ncbi:transcriptional repressor gene korB [Pseudomonas aeruginosa]|uniref:transcriptional repressor gene korB n=1 Tax=Pseudomonas aeruginosa TaxID=287 RepID=UPI002985075D|nr:ParB/RepB/Spo0J family partition protein [Pseudomonas putida]EKT4508239.1 ParB/RepB/Spo0J family partition protein [Pseudomonas putida]HBO7967996.1 ParB/RepB/Spo0J family partition protein [Pseudomonas aeruginosa]
MGAKADKKPQEGSKVGGMDLGSIGDLSALLHAPEAPAANTGPLILDMSLIDEDPNQPRTEDNPGFSADAIAEIGATIKARGVKTPISVRDNPEAPGRYLINHGARRFRGSKWAEKTTIPAWIDNDYNEADQVIENLQRNDLTAREIADFIGRELAKGKKKGDIAKEIGKSASFVSQHVTLLDLPDPIAEAFNSGRVKDVTLINELVTAHKKAPEEVTDWLEDDSQEVTRGTVKLLREYLDDKGQDSNGESLAEQALREARERNGGGEESEEEEEGEQGGRKDAPEADPTKLKKAIVQVEHDGRLARLTLNKRPSSAGLAWMKYEDDGAEFEAVLSDVKLVQLLEG